MHLLNNLLVKSALKQMQQENTSCKTNKQTEVVFLHQKIEFVVSADSEPDKGRRMK